MSITAGLLEGASASAPTVTDRTSAGGARLVSDRTSEEILASCELQLKKIAAILQYKLEIDADELKTLMSVIDDGEDAQQ